MQLEEINTKEILRIYGSFLGLLLFFIMSIIGLAGISKKSWNNNLKKTVQTILEEKCKDKWIIGNPIRIKSPFSLNAALFEVHNKRTGENGYAIIIRTATLCGPIPAVYIYIREQVIFAGYSAGKGRIKTLLEKNNTNPRTSYWQKRIPNIIKDSVGEKR